MNNFEKKMVQLALRLNSFPRDARHEECRQKALEVFLSHFGGDKELLKSYLHFGASKIKEEGVNLFQLVSITNARIAAREVIETGVIPRIEYYISAGRCSEVGVPHWWSADAHFAKVYDGGSYAPGKCRYLWPHLERALQGQGYMVVHRTGVAELVSATPEVFEALEGAKTYTGVDNDYSNLLYDLVEASNLRHVTMKGLRALLKGHEAKEREELVERETLFTKKGFEAKRLAAAGLL